MSTDVNVKMKFISIQQQVMYAGMQDDETVVAGQCTSLFDWQPVDVSAPGGILHYDASKNMHMHAQARRRKIHYCQYAS